MANENNPMIDLLGAADQVVDAMVTAKLKKAAEENNDEFAIALMNLCAEYGITGRKLIEFVYKIDALMKLNESLPTKDGDT